MVSVRDLMEMPVLERAAVIAGRAGLHREVAHVTVMEVPDIKRWLKGGDLLITSLYSVRDSEDAQCRLIGELADTCACLAVKTGQYVRTISPRVRAAADLCGLPLIELPYELAYIDILVSVMNRLMEDRGAEEVLQKYLNDILYENYLDEGVMVERGRLLGLSVERHCFAALLLSPRAASVPPLSMEHWIHELRAAVRARQSVRGCYRAATRRGTLLLVESDDEAALQRLMDSLSEEGALRAVTDIDAQAAGLGLGPVCRGLAGIRETFLAASKAFQAGDCLYPRRAAYPYGRLRPLCVCQELFAKDAHQALSGILTGLHSPELTETLLQYFAAEGDVDRAAEALFVHRNTVKYRLRRLQERTGLSLRVPGDAFQLYLAALAVRFRQEGAPL